MRKRADLAMIALAAAAAAVAFPSLSQEAVPAAATSCLACHGDADMFEADHLEILERFDHDVHGAVGLSCHDCHGGNPSLDAAEDLDLAKDESFVGAPAHGDVPGFCGRCHSDPEYMRRFNPEARIDQEREYWTSQHGKALAAGDDRVATCIDCHGVHGILGADDTASQVYPPRVAETCRSCHSDPERMAGSVLPDGRPLPTDQYAHWRRSVHGAALLDREDLSAPTCNDCHGNHGATPPGVESVAFVCGRCHGREARLFRASGKHGALQEHNAYLEDAGDEGCRSCHEPPEPQASLTDVGHLAGCAVCHQIHQVVRPTVALLVTPETPCAFCHEGSGPLADKVLEPQKRLRNYERMKQNLLASVTAEGLEGSERFDWLVDRALALPHHTFQTDGDDGDGSQLRPEFRRLYEKFRIGKSAYTWEDPDSGEMLPAKVQGCGRCHATGGEASSGGPGGLEMAGQMLERMQELTSATARAERIVLAARRGGVETREAAEAIDAAVDAQIGLEVLVHTFTTAEGSAFAEKHAEGLEGARAALEAGQKAMDELASRRRWLALFLAFTVLVAIGVALKIREISIRERRSEEGVL